MSWISLQLSGWSGEDDVTGIPSQDHPPTARPDPLGDLEEAAELQRDRKPEGPGQEVDALSRRARRWTADQAFGALRDVACAISANLDLASLITQILDTAIASADAERGILFLGERPHELTPMLARKIGGRGEIERLERISRTVLQQAGRGRMVVTSDALRDARFLDAPSVQLQRIRAVICLPMVIRERPVGVIYIDAPASSRPFPSYIHELLEGLASLAAVALENARLHGEVLQENARLRGQVAAIEAFGRLRTVSGKMRTVLQRAALVARVDTPVTILGESGTGKELLARAIHDASPRALSPFVAINCAAVPRELVESIFFGHVKGAFTGASRDSRGIFQQADKGTLFLDEIAELGPEVQAKLLRVIEDNVIRPVGSQEESQVDVRLIAATSRDFASAIQTGQFREDLYFRISVLELSLPTLRERPEDIPILIEHFIAKHSPTTRAAGPVHLSSDAIAYLQTLPWRGNVRALENLVRRVLVLCESGIADVDQVRSLLSHMPMPEPPGAPLTPTSAPAPNGETDPRRARERESIREALLLAGGNRSKAARILGLHRNTLLRKMKNLEIGPAE